MRALLLAAVTRVLALALVLGGALVGPAARADAQVRVTGGDLRGRVTDQSGGVMPGVTVHVRSLATNVTRETTTDPEGVYRVAALEPGDYEVRAVLSGFAPGSRDRVRLQLGELVDVSFVLAVGGVEERVSVTAGTPVVSPEQTAVSTIITQRQIAQVPINGRRFIELAALAAGVTTGGPPAPGAEASGLSVLGQRQVSNSLLIDGLDNNDRTVGGASGAFSQESIREFQVLTGSYPAEFGNATGGVINIVTRSGTNTTEGSAFVFFRDEALNAKHYFERFDPFGTAIAQPKAPFRQWQTGLSLGLPLRRDRTFLFAAAERRAATTANFVTIDATAAALLNSAGFDVERGHVPYDDSASQIMARVDHYWTPQSSLVARVQWSDAYNGNYGPFGGLVARSAGSSAERRDWGIAASQTNVLGSRWVNEARLQVARQAFAAASYDPVGPRVTLVGVATAGRADFSPSERRSWLVQFKDTVTLSTSRHTVKTGLDVTTVDQQALVGYNFGGQYTFVALPSIPGLLPMALSPLQAFAAGLPAVYAQGYGDGDTPLEYVETTAFVQDDWRVTPRLTVRAGLRYQQQRFPDFNITIAGPGGAPVTYPFPLSDPHLSPRLAVAFDPGGDGRTSLHAAYGLFFGGQLTGVYSATSAFGGSGVRRLKVYTFPLSAMAWPLPGHRLPEGALAVPDVTITVGPDSRTPRVHQVSAGLVRDLGRGLVAGVEGVYARGFHQLGAIDYNPLVPSLGPGRRPNDLGGVAGTSASVAQYTDFGETWYRGLLVSLQQRFGAGHEYRVAYTLSSAEDNSTSVLGLVQDHGRGRDPQNPRGLPLGFDPDSERGPAVNDERHRLVVSGLMRLPWALEASAVLSAASGLPFTPLAGADLNGDGIGDTDRARRNVLDASSSVPRNSGRLPARVTMDVRVSRPFRVGARATMVAAAEAFNLLNRANISAVNNVFGAGSFPSNPQRDAQGRVTYGTFQQALAPRQVQLAVRLSF